MKSPFILSLADRYSFDQRQTRANELGCLGDNLMQVLQAWFQNYGRGWFAHNDLSEGVINGLKEIDNDIDSLLLVYKKCVELAEQLTAGFISPIVLVTHYTANDYVEQDTRWSNIPGIDERDEVEPEAQIMERANSNGTVSLTGLRSKPKIHSNLASAPKGLKDLAEFLEGTDRQRETDYAGFRSFATPEGRNNPREEQKGDTNRCMNELAGIESSLKSESISVVGERNFAAPKLRNDPGEGINEDTNRLLQGLAGIKSSLSNEPIMVTDESAGKETKDTKSNNDLWCGDQNAQEISKRDRSFKVIKVPKSQEAGSAIPATFPLGQGDRYETGLNLLANSSTTLDRSIALPKREQSEHLVEPGISAALPSESPVSIVQGRYGKELLQTAMLPGYSGGQDYKANRPENDIEDTEARPVPSSVSGEATSLNWLTGQNLDPWVGLRIDPEQRYSNENEAGPQQAGAINYGHIRNSQDRKNHSTLVDAMEVDTIAEISQHEQRLTKSSHHLLGERYTTPQPLTQDSISGDFHQVQSHHIAATPLPVELPGEDGQLEQTLSNVDIDSILNAIALEIEMQYQRFYGD